MSSREAVREAPAAAPTPVVARALDGPAPLESLGGALGNAQFAALARSPPPAAFRPTMPILARKGPDAPPAAPASGTPAGTIEDAKKSVSQGIAAKKKEIVDSFWSGADSFLQDAPKIAKDPIESYKQRLKQGADEWLGQVQEALKQWLTKKLGEIANSDIANGIKQEAKKVASAVDENEIVREIVEQLTKLLKELYEKDSITLAKKFSLGKKIGELKGVVKVSDITSGARKVAAELTVVTKSFTATIAYKDDKLSIDMSAQLAKDTALKGHLDETGGKVTLTMITKSGQVVPIDATVDGSGKGTAPVPAQIRELLIQADVEKAKAKVAGSFSQQSYAADPNRPGAIRKTDALSVKAELEKSLVGRDWGAKVDVKYQNDVVRAAIEAAVKNAEGKTRAEVRAEVEVVLNKTFSLVFGASASTGPGGTSVGGSAGVKVKPLGATIGMGTTVEIPGSDGGSPKITATPVIKWEFDLF